MARRSVSFGVNGLPPKKDGASSMWNNPTERHRIIELRKAAVDAMSGQPPFSSQLHLEIRIYANVTAGDLDNFITGICDGLMAVHTQAPIDLEFWRDVPAAAQPRHAIVYVDDKQITKIEAERHFPDSATPHYHVKLSCID